MLPKKYRVKFPYPLERSLFIVNSPFFKATIYKNQLNHPRFAVFVPAKTLKLAVKRNYAKRLILNLIFNNFLKKTFGFDVFIVIVKPITLNDKNSLIVALNRIFA